MTNNIREIAPFSATEGVHAGRLDLTELGVHALPLDLSTTYPLPDLDVAEASLDALANGDAPVGNPLYARLHNPTVARFEKALAVLEGADGAVAFGSGMAAITAVLLAARICRAEAHQATTGGGHVVAVRPLYGGTDHLLAAGLLGMEVSFVAPERVAAAMRSDTLLVLLETPANPTCELRDIAAVVAAATWQGRAVPVMVDSTFATPVLQRPLAHGATLALHSATKFIGGHGDAMGGVVASSNEAFLRALRQVRILTGGVLHPLAAYLLHRGLQTLGLRVRQAQASAEVLAQRLLAHPAVERVYFPGLTGGDPLQLIGRQMAGPGALVSFDLAGGQAAAQTLLGAVRLITPAVSLGSTDTLVQHPAGLTHRAVAPADRRAMGLGDGLVRLAVGLEEVDDLWLDLAQALDAALRQGVPRVLSVAA